jgi:hypothetical protein
MYWRIFFSLFEKACLPSFVFALFEHLAFIECKISIIFGQRLICRNDHEVERRRDFASLDFSNMSQASCSLNLFSFIPL